MLNQLHRAKLKLFSILDNPTVWKANRLCLDLIFGLYRKRIRTMREWGLLDNAPSVLDVGCGIGQYARITTGNYRGIDLNARYIDYANRGRRHANRSFQCMNVTEVAASPTRFDLVLMVDFLHHIPDDTCVDLLTVAGRLAMGNVVCFEPVSQQQNPIGRWIIANDRGEHMRTLEATQKLFARAALPIRATRELQLGPIKTVAILAQPSAVASALPDCGSGAA